MLDIPSILFYVIASVMCLSGLLVITLRQPVYAIMCLVKAIVCAAILWMIMSAEFLSLALIFVYVGAVMTLFLFVAITRCCHAPSAFIIVTVYWGRLSLVVIQPVIHSSRSLPFITLSLLVVDYHRS